MSNNKNTNGKGDKFRPTNLKEYRNNYDSIFGKKSAKRIYRELDKSGANPDNILEEESLEVKPIYKNKEYYIFSKGKEAEYFMATRCCNLDTDNDGNCPIHPKILDK